MSLILNVVLNSRIRCSNVFKECDEEVVPSGLLETKENASLLDNRNFYFRSRPFNRLGVSTSVWVDIMFLMINCGISNPSAVKQRYADHSSDWMTEPTSHSRIFCRRSNTHCVLTLALCLQRFCAMPSSSSRPGGTSSVRIRHDYIPIVQQTLLRRFEPVGCLSYRPFSLSSK